MESKSVPESESNPSPLTTSGNAHGCGDGNNRRKGREGKHNNKDKKAAAAPSVKKIKEEVFLVVSLAVTGRTPLNGWIMSIGAVAVAASSRKVLGVFERNCAPLLPDHYVEPSVDVAGFWKKQRPELEHFYRLDTQVSAMTMIQDLRAFCEPYASLTLVGSPLFSIYGWLSYYWSHTFPAPEGEPQASMPWGFSGVCAKSYASGHLGVSMKKLSGSTEYKSSFEGYQVIGLPVADAIAAAASFTYLYSRANSESNSSEAVVPPFTFHCEVPALLTELGYVALDARGSGTASSMKERALHESIVSGLDAAHVAQLGPFCEYPSITDYVHHANFIEQTLAAAVGADDVEWVATEKVHGSNMTIFTDGNRIWAGKRTGWLKHEDSSAFFEFPFVIENARPAIMRAHQLALAWMQESHSDSPASVVSIMCELAGGVYPHPNVPVDLRGVRVQNGVYYAPYNFLYGFDIAVEPSQMAVKELNEVSDNNITSSTSKDGRFYLPFDVSERVFKEAGFQSYATARHRGTLRQLMSVPVAFTSTIATDQLGLPVIDGNDAEGLVLRPVTDTWIRVPQSDPSSAPVWSRVILKRKHPRFEEFAVANSAKTLRARDKNQHQDAACDLTPFLNAARVESVLSKYTASEQADTAKMVQAVLADALKDAKTYAPMN